MFTIFIISSEDVYPKRNWVNGSFDGDIIGYNVRLTSGSSVVELLRQLEKKIERNGLAVKSRTSSTHCYLPIRGNARSSETT